MSTWGVQYISAGLGAIMGAIFPMARGDWFICIKRQASCQGNHWFIAWGLPACIISWSPARFSECWFPLWYHSVRNCYMDMGHCHLYTAGCSLQPYFSLGLQMLISGICLTVFTNLVGSYITRTISNSVCHPDLRDTLATWALLLTWLCLAFCLAFVGYLYHANSANGTNFHYAYINPSGCDLRLAGVRRKDYPYIAIGGLVTFTGVFLVNKAFKAVPTPEQPEAEDVERFITASVYFATSSTKTSICIPPALE